MIYMAHAIEDFDSIFNLGITIGLLPTQSAGRRRLLSSSQRLSIFAAT